MPSSDPEPATSNWNIFSAYVRFVNSQIAETRKPFAKVLLAIAFYLFTPVGVLLLIGGALVAIDQATYPTNAIDPAFAEPGIGAKPLPEKGALLVKSIYVQLERELDSPLGWAPNDLCCLQFFDNRLNRQKGVIHGVRELASVLSVKISKYGLGGKEDEEMKQARQSKFAFDEDNWGWYAFTNSEKYYYEGIELTKSYQARLLSGEGRINITTADIYDILIQIKDGVLGEPYGRLVERGRHVPSLELDDQVYYAQGAAIVARDALTVLFNAFKKEMDKGADENMTVAIDSLNAAIVFNPWWVERGDGASMWADHRSKMSRYYSEAIRRIEDVAQSMRR